MRLTLREYDYLVQRHILAQEREMYNVALICTMIANTHRGEKQKPLKPQDFMPKKPQSAKQQINIVEALNRAFGGEDRRAK